VGDDEDRIAHGFGAKACIINAQSCVE